MFPFYVLFGNKHSNPHKINSILFNIYLLFVCVFFQCLRHCKNWVGAPGKTIRCGINHYPEAH